jgi:hypothetical protein
LRRQMVLLVSFQVIIFLKIDLWFLTQLVCMCMLHVLCVHGLVSSISGCDVNLFHTNFSKILKWAADVH